MLYSRGLGWASSEALQKLNWCGSQYLFSAFVPNSNFPKKMWISNAVLTGQNLPHPVYERVSETVENSWPFCDTFCTKLSSILELDNGQLFRTTVNMCS